MAGDQLAVDPSALSFGIFRDVQHLRATTELLLAGVPTGIDLTLSWRAEAGILTFVGISPPGGVDVWIEREFEALSPSNWTVIHQMFRLPDAHHSSGSSVRMMRGSVQAYDDLGVTQIELNADVDFGGYVWAKIGFAPDNAGPIRDRIAEGHRAYPTSMMYATLAGVAARSSDDDLMYHLARASAPDGSSYGKLLLSGVGWYGHLDLTNQTHRQRLAVIF